MGLKSLHGSWLGGMRASFAIAVCALAAVEAGADEHRSAFGLSVGYGDDAAAYRLGIVRSNI